MTEHVEIDQRNLAARLKMHREYVSDRLKKEINGTKVPWPKKPKEIKVKVAFLQDLRNTLYAAEQIQQRGFCEPPSPMQDECERRI